MKTAKLHRAWWCYENNLGIAKVHYPRVGIIAFLFELNTPICDVNFLDKDTISFYFQQYKKQGITIRPGYQIDRDVEVVRVIETAESVKFPDWNLEIKIEGESRYFRSIDGEWQLIEDAPVVEYQRCDSLICVT